MNGLPELALQAKSLEELMKLAAERGYKINSEKLFLRDLQDQWQAYLRTELTEWGDGYSTRPLPTTIPHLETTIKGKHCGVYGVIHEQEPSEPYLKMVKEVFSLPHWLIEQNLKKKFNLRSGIEIPDHYIKKWKGLADLPKYFALGFRRGITFPLTKTENRKRTQKSELTLAEAASLHHPPSIFNKNLPCHLDLELKEREKNPVYSEWQRRSAYQAEFLRAWRDQDDRNILVGAAHATDIIHFLEKRIGDQRIVDLAHNHAELLQTDPEKYYSMYAWIRNLEMTTIQITMVTGFVTPYATLAYLLF